MKARATLPDLQITQTLNPAPMKSSRFIDLKPLSIGSSEVHRFAKRLLSLPVLPTDGLRDCQIRAINNLEVSFKENRPRALIQMATGSGKTFTAITSVYRLLKFAGARRILFSLIQKT